jgi:hypothetical protein
MVRQCSSAHCGAVDAEINEICIGEGWAINHPVLTRDENGPCNCSCSCLAFGTMVQVGDGSFKAIETFVVGDRVLAAGTDLDWSAEPVVYSGGTTGASRQKYTVLVLYSNTAVAVTSDHLFLVASGGERALKQADRLTVEDSLISPAGHPVQVRGVHIGDYLAGFHHVAARTKFPGPGDLDGHLLNTNGVISADYAVQILNRSGEAAGFTSSAFAEAPLVGSAEYVSRYGDSCLKTPELPSGFDEDAPIRTASFDAPDVALSGNTFIPAEAVSITVPEGACSFIPPDLAEEKRSAPKRAFNDPQAREWVEALIRFHRQFYPDVNYIFDWTNDDVNAYAWVENGVRQVAMMGGLVRDQDLELEGLALVLAHELAHHYGGSPTGTSGLSCEGQADYFGVRNVMRKVWFGESYITTTDAGIAQMAAFFGVPADSTDPGGSAGCAHPAGRCRIVTYRAAVSLTGKPGCAS